MEQYHAYMKECSKVAALGGTITSTGETYEPGFFNSFVEKLEEKVIAAATEKTADNVYYMNNIRQPNGVKKGIPNLEKIIAMRSVGVVNQVDGVDAFVSAYGCDLSTLGNAIRGDNTKTGRLTAVDTATGIYVTADYAGGRNTSAPVLTVTTLGSDDVIYDMFRTSLGCGAEDLMTVYKIVNKGTSGGMFTLTGPMTIEQMQALGEFRFYTHKDEMLQQFYMTGEDNLFTGEVEAIDYIVVVKGSSIAGGEEQPENFGDGEEVQGGKLLKNDASDDDRFRIILAGGAVAVLLLSVVGAVIIKRKKNSRS